MLYHPLVIMIYCPTLCYFLDCICNYQVIVMLSKVSCMLYIHFFALTTLLFMPVGQNTLIVDMRKTHTILYLTEEIILCKSLKIFFFMIKKQVGT